MTSLDRLDAVASAEILIQEEDGKLTVTFNRPDRLNAFSQGMLDGLPELLGSIAARTDIRVVVFTGAGRGFCSGADLAQTSPAEASVDVEAELRRRASAVEVLAAMPQVTIAAINGSCAGMGVALAAACDLRIAAVGAVVSTSYLTAGLPGDFGGLWFLSRIIGPALAKQWYLLPDRVTAEDARSAGFVTRVVPRDELLEAVGAVASRLLGSAPGALRAIKENAADVDAQDLASYLNVESARHATAKGSADAREARLAFLEKRQPAFTGR